MQFLAPLFLAGAAAVTLPLLFHLVRRTPKGRVSFSALMFLEPSAPRVRRRSRVENIVLLILRCLAVCLLALAFARPFFPKPPVVIGRQDAGGERITLLLDTSASMRGEPWEKAVAAARRIIGATTADDELALVAFDRGVRPIVTFEEWTRLPATTRAAQALAKLDAISPGWAATRAGNALIAAAESLADQPADTARKGMKIVLVSDVQRSSGLDEVESYDWPKGLRVTVERTTRELSSNAALRVVPGPARLRVISARDAQTADFRVEWKGGTRALHLPPGASEAIALPPGAERVTLSGDDVDFDNTAFVVPSELRTVRVAYPGGDQATDPNGLRYYLERAFQTPMPRYRVELSGAVEKADVFVIAERVADPAALRQFVTEGGSALLVLRNAAMAETLSALAGGIVVDEAASRDALLSDVNFKEPLFAPFADPRFGDFTKIHFWKHRRVDLANAPGARVLARFDDGTPAVFRLAIGKGDLLVLTAGWQPEDSQLALSSKFVPLMHSVLETAGVIRERVHQFNVGDPVPLAAGVVRKPDGSEAALKPNATSFSETDQPGIYSTGDFRLAVNVDPRESELAPISDEELAALGLPTAVTKRETPVAADQLKLADEEQERRQKLWWWLIAATLVVLAVETLGACLANRPRAVPTT